MVFVIEENDEPYTMKKRHLNIFAFLAFFALLLSFSSCDDEDQSAANKDKKFSVEYKVVSPLVGYEQDVRLNETGKLQVTQNTQGSQQKKDTITSYLSSTDLNAFRSAIFKLRAEKIQTSYGQVPLEKQTLISRNINLTIDGKIYQIDIYTPEEVPFDLTLLLSSVEEMVKKYHQ